MNYYNEFDPKAAAWLRQLIADGLIPPGHVDERSIRDVQPGDFDGFTQCHFFAGIGGWPFALQLACVSPDEPVWTGSCPCQPFSVAGKGDGQSDGRHLWPEMFRLMRACRPAITFGEQVEGAVRLGWLDGVRADLEAEGYAFGAHVLGAHSVGAPHIRQRLYWVANATSVPRAQHVEESREGLRRPKGPEDAAERRGDNGRVVYPVSPGLEGHAGNGDNGNEPGRVGAQSDGPATPAGGWSNFDIVQCADRKARRVESGTFPLVAGLPAGMVQVGDPSIQEVKATAEARVARLRGYGNSIVPQLAAEFIKAAMEAIQ